MMNWRTVALNTALTGISLLVATTLVDQALRLAESRGFTLEQVSHPPNMVERRENVEFNYVFTTNAQGLRNAPLPEQKPAGTYRVLVVGDSFVEGYGVDMQATFTAQLQDHYRDRSVEFINAGLSGQGPQQYKTLIQAYTEKLDIDAVLLCLFANDLSDMGVPLSYQWHEKLVFTLWPRLATMAREIKHRLTPAAPVTAPARETQFVNRIISMARKNGISNHRIEQWKAALDPQWVEAANQGKISATLLSFGLLHPNFWSESIDVNTPEAQQKWQHMRETLQDIEEIASSSETELAVVYIPSVFQFDASSFEFDRPWPALGATLRKSWLKGETRIKKLLRQSMEKDDVNFLDLTPALRQAVYTEKLPLNFQYDEHFNANGHRVTAEILDNWFEKDPVFSFLQ